jgi:hypothetical protein
MTMSLIALPTLGDATQLGLLLFLISLLIRLPKQKKSLTLSKLISRKMPMKMPQEREREIERPTDRQTEVD